MSILVIAEHDNKALNAATLNVVAAAQKIGGDITVLVAGSGAQARCGPGGSSCGCQQGITCGQRGLCTPVG